MLTPGNRNALANRVSKHGFLLLNPSPMAIPTPK